MFSESPKSFPVHPVCRGRVTEEDKPEEIVETSLVPHKPTEDLRDEDDVLPLVPYGSVQDERAALVDREPPIQNFLIETSTYINLSEFFCWIYGPSESVDVLAPLH